MTVRRPPLAIMKNAPLPTPAAEPSLMGMPNAAERWTREKVWALPDDGRRYELIDGELVVTPAPAGRHQVAVGELYFLLRLALARTPGTTARLLFSPADISLGEDEILQPDLFIYRSDSDHKIGNWRDITMLFVAIEVLSPSTARYDRGLKRLRYQRARVSEYWIVDLDGRLVERWRPDDARPEILNARLQWSSGDGAEVDLDLEAFFREVAGK
jgi:Uma2 family endonuclease